MWPFQSKTLTRDSFPIGKYELGASLKKTADLVEFSNHEYEIMGRQFEGEYNYNAPFVNLLGHLWKLQLGTVHNKIYKIAAYLELATKQEANPAVMEILRYCIEKLGKPSSQKIGLFMWDTIDGNVILQTAETTQGLGINLFLTSNSVRNFKRL